MGESTSPAPAERSPLHRAIDAGYLQDALLLALLLVVFLWTPLSRLDDAYYSSADFLQDFTLLQVEPGHVPENLLLTDPAIQMQAWTMFNREELWQGRLPLWSPYNAGGAPHLANYQSAVLSPFSLPFYTLDLPLALVVAAFLKLHVLGLFTYLFLRKLGLKRVPALLGGTIFMFSGHNVVLLGYPHVAAICHLPAGLYFVEVACVRMAERLRPGTATSRPGLTAPCAGLCLALTAALLGGHPEAVYFGLILVALYALWRLATLRLEHGRAHARAVAGLALKLGLAGVLAAGLAAPQLLPFLEYFEHSTVRIDRNDPQTPLSLATFPLQVFPNALGNPGDQMLIRHDVPAPDYELVTMSYVGGLALLLAALALRFPRDRRVRFFAAIAAVWFVYSHQLLGSGPLFASIPTLGMAPMNRSQPVWGFCLAALAALTLDHALRRQPVARPGARAIGLTLLAAIAAVTAVAALHRAAVADLQAVTGAASLEAVEPYYARHLWFVLVTITAGAAGLCVAWMAPAPGARATAAAALVPLAFLQSGWLLRDYNPTIDEELFFPTTPAIEGLKEVVGTEPYVVLGADHVPPPANIMYGLSTLASYDAMWVNRYDKLYERFFSERHNWRDVSHCSERGLNLFGARWVLAKWGWPEVDTGTSGVQWWLPDPSFYLAREVVRDRDIVQTFIPDRDRLQAVCLYLSTSPGYVDWSPSGLEIAPGAPECTLEIRVEDVVSGEVIVRRELTAREVHGAFDPLTETAHPPLPNIAPPGRYVVVPFEPRPDSRGRQHRIVLSTPDGDHGATVIAWALSENPVRDAELTVGTTHHEGDLIFDWSTNLEAFAPRAELGRFTLFEYLRGSGTEWTVAQALEFPDGPEMLEMLSVSFFDPGQLALIAPDDGPPLARLDGAVEPTSMRLISRAGEDYVFLVDEERERLLHIHDELVFIAHGFGWENIDALTDDEYAAQFGTYDRWGYFTHGYEIYDRIEEEYGFSLCFSLPGRRSDAAAGTSPPEERPDAGVEVLERVPGRLRLRARLETSGHVIITQPFYPGWRATVDGAPVTLRRANSAFCAVPIEAGESVVELRYAPTSLRLGLLLAGVSAALGLVLVAGSARRA